MTNSNPKTIGDGVVVAIHYTLKLDDGSEVDSSRGGDPLLYLHGQGNIVPGLEHELTGRGPGERFEVSVSPDEGYGARFPDAVQRVSKTQLPDDFEPEVGMQLSAETAQGQFITLHIVEVGEDDIAVDPNHPLAGETLNFSIEVVSLRAATKDEMEHGHPHGPGGHHH
ncbi:MAG: peptidylprolyl isomerase [Planctomycetota bacterium]